MFVIRLANNASAYKSIGLIYNDLNPRLDSPLPDMLAHKIGQNRFSREFGKIRAFVRCAPVYSSSSISLGVMKIARYSGPIASDDLGYVVLSHSSSR